MKKFILFLQITLVTLFFSEVSAQKKLPPASEPYWIIEHNIKTPKHSIVYFYSINHEVMFRENVDGKRLNPDSPRIRKILNEALKEVTQAWKEGKLNDKNKLIAMRRI